MVYTCGVTTQGNTIIYKYGKYEKKSEDIIIEPCFIVVNNENMSINFRPLALFNNKSEIDSFNWDLFLCFYTPSQDIITAYEKFLEQYYAKVGSMTQNESEK